MNLTVKASSFVKLPQKHREMLVKTGLCIPVNDIMLPYFGNKYKIVLLYGSYGNGKSKFAAQDLIEKCKNDKYFKCFYGRKVYDRIRASIFDELATEIEERGLEAEFTYSRKDNSTMIITHQNGNKFIPFGGDNPQSLKSIKDPTHIVCEEFDQFAEKDFGYLYSRLRTEKSYTQFIAMFNTEPLVKGHWIREMFFEKDNDTCLKIFGTYKDNYFQNKAEYEQKLRIIANGRTHIFQAIANGEFGVTSNDNPFFYTLYRDKHFENEKYKITQNQPLSLSFDFNKNPVSLIIRTYYENQHGIMEYSIIDCILANENTLNNATPLEAACVLFMNKYVHTGLIHPAYLTVTGDASGKNGSADLRANHNFYTKIQALLGINKYQIKTRNKNILHTLSQEICNGLISTLPFKIYKSAEIVLNDMSTAQIVNGTMVKDKDNVLHMTDAVRYDMDMFLGFDKWQSQIQYYKSKNTKSKTND